MQAGSAVRGASTIPRRGRLGVLVAIVVIAALVALVVWAAPFASNEFGTEEANPNSAGAGSSAVIHDDPENVHPNLSQAASSTSKFTSQIRTSASKNTGIMRASMLKDMGQMKGTVSKDTNSMRSSVSKNTGIMRASMVKNNTGM